MAMFQKENSIHKRREEKKKKILDKDNVPHVM